MFARYAIFCSDPLNPRGAEPDFSAEVRAARDSGFTPVLLDHDALDHRIDATEALRKARFEDAGQAVYRGWMLKSEAYRALYEALWSRRIRLLTDPQAYDACHHAPGSYRALMAFTPKTVWVDAARLDDGNAIDEALAYFGASAVIIKDWVKSQAAGYWSEACFIPDASDRAAAARVIARFRELQGDSLVGGIVFKAYVPLLPAGKPASEHRAFIVNGQVIGCWPRYEAANEGIGPPADLLKEIAARVPSPFASADFGIDETNRWWLLEVGDGQVSGLPSEVAALPIFKAIAEVMNAERE